tara:strand:+ start:174 stop:947 length:774 start_codon:yes stop_codon:yes gene_type:complete
MLHEQHILTSKQPARRTRQHGFTLVELMMATVGVSLMAIGITSMLTVVAYGTTSSRDLRSLVVKQKAVSARINAAVRGSKMVLESGLGYTVLWIHDDDEDGLPSLSEIRLVELNQTSRQIVSYKANLAGLSDAILAVVDTPIPLDSDFEDLTESFKDPQYFTDLLGSLVNDLPEIEDVGGLLGQIEDSLDDDSELDAQTLLNATLFAPEVWATTVTGFTLSLDNVLPQQAKLVGYQVTFEVGTLSDTTIGTAALRNE